jgi:hypothetical protein
MGNTILTKWPSRSNASVVPDSRRYEANEEEDEVTDFLHSAVPGMLCLYTSETPTVKDCFRVSESWAAIVSRAAKHRVSSARFQFLVSENLMRTHPASNFFSALTVNEQMLFLSRLMHVFLMGANSKALLGKFLQHVGDVIPIHHCKKPLPLLIADLLIC